MEECKESWKKEKLKKQKNKMEVKAKLKHLRIAPRKVRLVADLIRGKKITEAENILNFTIKGGKKPISKLLKSAVSNAKQNFGLEKPNLYIKKITVDEGRRYKKWMPRARGQASLIQKKTSHITVILDEMKKVKPVEKKGRRKPHPLKNLPKAGK